MCVGHQRRSSLSSGFGRGLLGETWTLGVGQVSGGPLPGGLLGTRETWVCGYVWEFWGNGAPFTAATASREGEPLAPPPLPPHLSGLLPL